MHYEFNMEDKEYWWGGSAEDACNNPYTEDSEYKADFNVYAGNQTMPLFVSSNGRYIWSEKPFAIEIKDGQFIMDGEDIILEKAGDTLKEAYLAACRKHFPFSGKKLMDSFFKTAQYNTWMEFTYHQTQDGVLSYAEKIVENGFEPGILMIDEGWQVDYGQWCFDKAKFPNPKKMVDRLHDMGFKVMLWVSPYVSLDGEEFVMNTTDIFCGDKKLYMRIDDEWNNVAINRWWNGFSGILNLANEEDAEFLDNQLKSLVENIGIDGFKFDGGALAGYSQSAFVNGPVKCDLTAAELNIAWNKFGEKYEYHEYKDTWKGGGSAVIQRLQDRSHDWTRNGINTILPTTLLQGLIGHPFICPDMIGGGEWSYNNLDGFKVDEELFIRMAQVSALCPMMQFSWAPWRVLSKEGLECVKAAATIHEKMSDTILKLVREAEISGEPIVRTLEYEFPHSGFETVTDKFMLGSDIFVCPVTVKGQTTMSITFPSGKWTDGKECYDGGKTYEINTPIDVLPIFYKA